MTSDGIKKRDWNRVHAAAIKVVNASLAYDVQKENLFSLLDELQQKYGLRPSILATKGDFADNLQEAIGYLEDAYSQALKIGDFLNQSYILSSLASNYFKGGKFNDCQKCINSYERLLREHPDIDQDSDVQDIKNSIKEMIQGGK